LAKKGYKILFENDVCKIRINDKTMIEGVQSKVNDNLYELKQIENQVLSATETDKWKLWHHRLGHLSNQNMKKLTSKDTNFNSKNLKQEFCQDCALGKSSKLPHKTVEEKRTDKIIIHSDLAGPMRTESYGKKKYMVTYICNQTDYSFVYFLRSKHEQFNKFKEFKSQYELQRSVKIQGLQTDNGSEYLSTDFQSYLKENGIIHYTSVPYCPQSNGKSERLNRTLIEKARCMMIAADVPQYLWTAAVETANYLRNRSPSSILLSHTPYEKFNNNLPKLSHLKVFGCDAYPLELTNQGSKFEPRAKKHCIMIGYGKKEGIYWIYDKTNKKIFASRDVKFNEDSVLSINDSNYGEFEIVEEENIVENNNGNDDDANQNDRDYENPNDQEQDEIIQLKEEIQSDINHEENTNQEDNSNILNNNNENIQIQQEDRNKPNNESLKTRINKRDRKQTKKYDPCEYNTQNTFAKFLLNASIEHEFLNEPKTYEEALSSSARHNWEEAINSELDSLDENETWQVCSLPEGKNALGTKWVFKIKYNSQNVPERYKARLVAKGFDQEEGIDYKETFSPVVKVQSIRLLLAISVNEGLFVHHVDISTAFLYGILDEDVYIEPPQGLRKKLEQNQVLKLNKALYGLKQASRSWNKTIVSFFQELNLKQLQTDNCIFSNENLIVAIYVDDIVIIGSNEMQIIEFKMHISNRFKTKDLGRLSLILGLQIEYPNTDSLIIHQKNYIDKIIRTFELNDKKGTDIPLQPNQNISGELLDKEDKLRNLVDTYKYRKTIGMLIYLMVGTRPDICFSVSLLSRFMQSPRELHWRLVKKLLLYVKTTQDYCLIYTKTKTKENISQLIGYSDADYAGSVDDRKSTSGYIFKYNNCVVTWNSAKQKTVSLSSTEAEYLALTTAIKEALWLKQLLSELNRKQEEITMYCDNKSTICLSKNPEFHSRTKHIDIRYHFIKEKITEKIIKIEYIPTDQMLADILTKALPRIKHYKALESLKIQN
jgi:hypothetical protein